MQDFILIISQFQLQLLMPSTTTVLSLVTYILLALKLKKNVDKIKTR